MRKRAKSINALLEDGSFVTTKSDPGDIDLVLVLAHDYDFAADLPPAHYNVLPGTIVDLCSQRA